MRTSCCSQRWIWRRNARRRNARWELSLGTGGGGGRTKLLGRLGGNRRWRKLRSVRSRLEVEQLPRDEEDEKLPRMMDRASVRGLGVLRKIQMIMKKTPVIASLHQLSSSNGSSSLEAHALMTTTLIEFRDFAPPVYFLAPQHHLRHSLLKLYVGGPIRSSSRPQISQSTQNCTGIRPSPKRIKASPAIQTA